MGVVKEWEGGKRGGCQKSLFVWYCIKKGNFIWVLNYFGCVQKHQYLQTYWGLNKKYIYKTQYSFIFGHM